MSFGAAGLAYLETGPVMVWPRLWTGRWRASAKKGVPEGEESKASTAAALGGAGTFPQTHYSIGRAQYRTVAVFSSGFGTPELEQ
jgi:hypothetical protein